MFTGKMYPVVSKVVQSCHQNYFVSSHKKREFRSGEHAGQEIKSIAACPSIRKLII